MPDLAPEQKARQQIDAMLLASGWVVQDYKAFNPSAAPAHERRHRGEWAGLEAN
jgi:hypothetical protein